jgi:three-Cys-motif partner protein
MVADGFFDTPEEQSVVKTTIVTNYFDAWSNVMLPRVVRMGKRLAYVDLFCGPGRYKDGTPSTPIWVLQYAIRDPRLCARLLTAFNDKDPEHVAQLSAAVANLPGVEKLVHRPLVSNGEVGRDAVELLRNGTRVPTLFFVDPFGYKGLSLDLIGNAIKSWGCDCIFFFNYNRINPGITNPSVVECMNDLFGAERAERLRAQVKDQPPGRRQTTIIGVLTEALKDVGGRFVLAFEFQSQHGGRTSHYVIFVSKAFLGYHIMKDVMEKVSTDRGEVKGFVYVPVKSTQMELFPALGSTHSIPLLMQVLTRAAAGSTASVWDIYERFTVDTPYTLRHVQDALLALEAEGRVAVDRPPAKRMRRGNVTLGKDRVVTFPP